MRSIRPLLLALCLISLAGCESMDGMRQSFESLNKVLSPLAVLKKGSS